MPSPNLAEPSLRRGRAAVIILGLALWLWGLLGGLAASQWRLEYTLDDAWIHLQLAEQLAHGHMGLQPGQLSAPSSSPLWPFLLAPFAGSSFMHWIPLILNALCLLASLWLLSRLLFPERSSHGRTTLPLALAVVAASNLPGLALTGMEHSLQVLLALLLLRVLQLRAETPTPSPRLDWTFALLCLLGPLVRYEMLALVLPAILLDPAPTRGRAGLVLRLLLACLPLGLYSLWLHSLGLGWLPGSLAAKSDLVASSGTVARLRALVANGLHNVQLPQGRVLAGLGLVLAACGFNRSLSRVTRRLAFWAALAIALHLLAGRTGWLNRYEIQVWLPGLVVGLGCLRELLGRDTTRIRGAGPVWLVPGLLLLAGLPYLRTTLESPTAMANIHEQQAQLARFAQQIWRGPVAVNDIGRVSWRNPWPVLDLWGLASPRALAARRASAGADWADRLAREQGVQLVMIYPDWFDKLPESWISLGRLHLASRRVSSDRDAVEFFTLDSTAAVRARLALAEFIPGLPPGVLFTRSPMTGH
ncbi:MAG: hypothetical protein KDC10_02735 [Calditrichaeota bacterium]|nr:hypothetical protein [Calditrichota bacterium]